MRTLIVEDDDTSRAAVAGVVKPYCREIFQSDSLSGALEILQNAERIDLLILDLKLGDSSAARTLSNITEMKRLQPGCAILVVSGMIWNDEQTKQCYAAGADVVCVKDCELMKKNALLICISKSMKIRKTAWPDEPDFIHYINLLEEAIAAA